MSETKTMIRFFTIADYEDEEIWLREQHRKGWKLQRMIVPCFYIFEACTPEDVIYRLDYRNNEEDSEYLQLFRDYGWEQFARCMGWLYFRKSASEIGSIRIPLPGTMTKGGLTSGGFSTDMDASRTCRE